MDTGSRAWHATTACIVQLIDEGMSEWSDKLNVDAVAEQFKRMADLLTKSYPGTAKIVATVGSAWERVASNTSKNYS